jgi:hypothetical protein
METEIKNILERKLNTESAKIIKDKLQELESLNIELDKTTKEYDILVKKYNKLLTLKLKDDVLNQKEKTLEALEKELTAKERGITYKELEAKYNALSTARNETHELLKILFTNTRPTLNLWGDIAGNPMNVVGQMNDPQ